jgi:hypothetical protein
MEYVQRILRDDINGGALVYDTPNLPLAGITANFTGIMSVAGGRGTVPRNNGSAGTVSGPKCARGEGTVLCRPCLIGFYKDTEGTSQCLPCTNKPDKAVYTTAAWTSADCPFDCLSGFSGSQCKSVVQMLISGFGGVVGFVIAIIGLLAALVCCVGCVWRARYLQETQQQVCRA